MADVATAPADVSGKTHGLKRKKPSATVIDGTPFSNIHIEYGQITVRGGVAKRKAERMALTIETFEMSPAYTDETTGLTHPAKSRNFFHVSKSHKWFCTLVSGHSNQSRGMNCITILDKIRDAITNHFVGRACAAEETARAEIVPATPPNTAAQSETSTPQTASITPLWSVASEVQYPPSSHSAAGHVDDPLVTFGADDVDPFADPFADTVAGLADPPIKKNKTKALKEKRAKVTDKTEKSRSTQ